MEDEENEQMHAFFLSTNDNVEVKWSHIQFLLAKEASGKSLLWANIHALFYKGESMPQRSRACTLQLRVPGFRPQLLLSQLGAWAKRCDFLTCEMHIILISTS